MAVKTSWAAGDVLLAADLTDTFAAKAPLASPALTGTPTIGGVAITSLPGLRFITSQSFSAASTINVDNCFTSTYANYRIMLNVDSNSVDNAVLIRMRASGSDNASANYYHNGPEVATSSTTTPGVYRSAGLANQWQLVGGDNSDTGCSCADIFNPQASKRTAMTMLTISMNSTDMRFITNGGLMSVTTAYDGFSLIANTGNITGSVYVYGYRNS